MIVPHFGHCNRCLLYVSCRSQQHIRTCHYHLTMALSTNATTMTYWREGDTVLVNFTGVFSGVLDGWFTWPERHHCGPCACKLSGVTLWPVRVDKLTHRLFPIDMSQGSHGYIVENTTLTRKVKMIQRSWRRHRTKIVTSARTIQRVFRQCISNPYHPMCQRRLLYEFTQMSPYVPEGCNAQSFR